MKTTTTVIRLALTAGLLVGVYRETGLFTVATVAGLCIANELAAIVRLVRGKA